MSKKRYLIILLPALLVLGAYFLLRFDLQADIIKQERKEGKRIPLKDTLGGQKLSVVDLRPLFIKRLRQLIQKTSNGLYDL